MGEQLLTPKELATELGFTVNYLARMRMEGGGIPFIKFGEGSRSAIRYRRSEIKKFLDDRTRRSTSDPRGLENE